MTSANETILPVSKDYGTPATASDLYAIFELTASTGKADAVRDLMLPIVAKARTEPGCKYCVLLQVQPESVRILTYEIWTSRDALENHMTSGRIKDLGNSLHTLLAKPFEITYMKALSPA